MSRAANGDLHGPGIEKTWSFLQERVSQVMEKLEEGMSYEGSMELYTSIYDFCTQNKLHRPANDSSQKGAHLQGAEIYQRLTKYMTAHLGTLLDKAQTVQGEDLLRYYSLQWKNYTVGAGFISHNFRYLNRHWVKREMDEGHSVYDVYTHCLVLWRRIIFDVVKDRVIAAVLQLIKKQRDGEFIETTLIQSVVNSYVNLGLDEKDPSKPTIDVYREHFGKPFVEATKQYYKAESEKFVLENSVSDYMKKAEARLHEEEGRVELYLHESSTAPLMQACEETLITAHSLRLQEEFLPLLEQDRQPDLTVMYALLRRMPDSSGLQPLTHAFEQHIKKAGLFAIEKVCPEGDEANIDAKEYVDAMLGVHAFYNALAGNSFQGDPQFIKSLDNACREFVNRNKVCRTSSSKSPELLAKYCDTLLKKTAKSGDDTDIEATLQSVMIIFKYVEDKDVFQKFYTKQLARRLVNASSASDDAEASMLSKLKEACGFEYTNKLQRMFGDMATSKDLNSAYSSHTESAELSETFDSDFLVLGGAFWPLTAPSSGYSIPKEIQQSFDHFTNFYHSKHSGRKLQWCWHLGKADIRTNYLGPKHTFTVSMYQLAILLAYNKNLSNSYDELQAISGVTDKNQLDGALNILVKAKILTLSQGKLGESNSVYALNTGFKGKKLKMNLNLPIKSDQKAETDETHKTVEEDRKMLTQSAIVRIMKARKVLKHTMLVQETISQVKNRFSPKIPDIKKCIDILIEKEYLERSDKDEYTYLA